MLPSIVSSQIESALYDYLRSNFPVSNPFFEDVLGRFFETDGLFKGPYVSVDLPFKKGRGDKDYFDEVPMGFRPYLHQELAFDRLNGSTQKSTIVATGTGSGKTDCFQYPILDYCLKNSGQNGIKAILIYPMNALATDQARRFARAIHSNEMLKGKVTAGLFVGQQEKSPSRMMSASTIITDKGALRNNPPDILLTNYKMLDYLFVRPRDKGLWAHNGPKILKYLVVDELHTFDGAQGTDLACLIRRLKSRLKTPPGSLCCVGTSATIGSEESAEELLKYAEEVFGEPFPKESLITEHRVSVDEFYSGVKINAHLENPNPEEPKLEWEGVQDPARYIATQYQLWFEEDIENPASEEFRIELGLKLKSHPFLRKLLEGLGGEVKSKKELSGYLKKILVHPELSERVSVAYLIESFLTLVSQARSRDPESGFIGPFLNVRFQLWVRELRRIVSSLDVDPILKHADDLPRDQASGYLPLVLCTDCGATGWGGVQERGSTEIGSDLKEFYKAFFGKQVRLRFLFPENHNESRSQDNLAKYKFCRDCRTISGEPDATECFHCGESGLIDVVIPRNVTASGSRPRGSIDCPFCNNRDGLSIFGARAATVISLFIAQLFSNRYNNDKKLIAFSDSVQDAAHRAGFVNARTYMSVLRSSMQQVLDAQGADLSILHFSKEFALHWKERLGSNKYITYFLGPNMDWLPEFEVLIVNGRLPAGSQLEAMVDKRVSWEIFSEYGFRARVGRTLEKSGVSSSYFLRESLDATVSAVFEKLQNDFSAFRNLSEKDMAALLLGLLHHLKLKGGIIHEGLETYIEKEGNSFVIRELPWMPELFPRSPSFLTNWSIERFEQLYSSSRQSRNWHEDWINKFLGKADPESWKFAKDIYERITKALVDAKVLLQREGRRGCKVWGINPEKVLVTKTVATLRCNVCSHFVATGSNECELLTDSPCHRYGCEGQYVKRELKPNYFGKLYLEGEIVRIIADEHTGLLSRDDRERIEKSFISGAQPWDTNILSATPTLEMGIDIGDLSSVLLCSVPPTEANYLQRIGRAGRKDGNSFSLTVASSRSHDLYFHLNPKEMISGKVAPPGVFLDASAVLERQVMAFSFDRWVEENDLDESELPRKVGDILNNVEVKREKAFPYTLLKFIQDNEDRLLKEFFALFKDRLGKGTVSEISKFVKGGKGESQVLSHRVLNGFNRLINEKKALKKKLDFVRREIEKTKIDPAAGSAGEEKLRNLETEKRALQELIRTITSGDTLNYFTDEGLLPNYTFPEAGVTLKSVIHRKKSKFEEGESKYDTWIYEYERPAAMGIRDLAPTSEFFAGGRKVEVKQIDLNVSDVEQWRACDLCSYSENISIEDKSKACPRCGSSQWPDAGQKFEFLRLTQVLASSRDKDSRIRDDQDNRDHKFFDREFLVDVEDHAIRQAFKIDDGAVPFGFEYVSRASFRELNCGEESDSADDSIIAGVHKHRSGFEICRKCGTVVRNKRDRKKLESHSFLCPNKEKDADKHYASRLFLYRELVSEAIKILLPFTTFSGSDEKLNSFMAALHLGLKTLFGGSVSHLRMTLQEEPIPGSVHRKRYLVLYDQVPGGTGYLKQLMKSKEEAPIFEVIRLALEKLESCGCNADVSKDGCYRCIYAYQTSFGMGSISRDTAIDLLSQVFEKRDKLVEVENLKSVEVNSLLESELEALFIDELRSVSVATPNCSFKKDIVNGKAGYVFKTGEYSYKIEPQVTLGRERRIEPSSRADFVFWPNSKDKNLKPIAIFADGFEYHKNRVGKDCAQRMAILQSGDFYIWSLSWKDVAPQHRGEEDYYRDLITEDLSPQTKRLFKDFLKGFGALEMHDRYREGSFKLFLNYLANPNAELWKKIAFCSALLWMNKEESFKQFETNLFHLLGHPAEEFLESIEGNTMQGVLKSDKSNRISVSRSVCATHDSIKNCYPKELFASVFLNDNTQAIKDPSFEKAWIGFLRAFNLLQFLPKSLMFSHSFVDQKFYSDISFRLAQDRMLETDELSGELKDWEELTEMVHPSACEFAMNLGDPSIECPVAGYELQGEGSEILAEAELAWPDKKGAVLLPQQLDFRDRFEKRGWKVFKFEESLLKDSEFLEFVKKG